MSFMLNSFFFNSGDDYTFSAGSLATFETVTMNDVIIH